MTSPVLMAEDRRVLADEDYGFSWGPVSVRRTTVLPDGRHVLTICGWVNAPHYFTEDHPSEIDVIVSKDGRRISILPRKGRVKLYPRKQGREL